MLYLLSLAATVPSQSQLADTFIKNVLRPHYQSFNEFIVSATAELSPLAE